jgi:drug/metabolite transporter (DMT)-like permease
MSRVVVVFLIGAIGISWAAIFGRLAAPAPPVMVALWRMIFAAPLLVGVALARGELPRGRDAWVLLIGGALFALDLTLWYTSLTLTSIANATLLVNTTSSEHRPVELVHPRRAPRLALLGPGGLGLGRRGPRRARGPGPRRGRVGRRLGHLGQLRLRRLPARREEARARCTALGAMAMATVGALLSLLAYALVMRVPLTGYPANAWWSFLGSAFVTHILGMTCIVWSLRYLRSTFAALALLAQPVGSTALAWLVLDESLGVEQGLGALGRRRRRGVVRPGGGAGVSV